MYAYTGTYKLEGSTLSIAVDAAAAPTWVGTTLRRKVALAGDVLTIETFPFKSLINNSAEVVVSTTFAREE